MREALARHVHESRDRVPCRGKVLGEVDGDGHAHVARTSVRMHDDETWRIGGRAIVLRNVFAGAGGLIAFGDVPVGSGKSGRT